MKIKDASFDDKKTSFEKLLKLLRQGRGEPITEVTVKFRWDSKPDLKWSIVEADVDSIVAATLLGPENDK